MEHKTCPHCHTYSGLRIYKTLLLSLGQWPMAIVYAVVVMAFGEKFNYSTNSTAIFIGLAVIPLLFKVLNKYTCDNCGMEFRAETPHEQEELHVRDL